LTQFITYKQIKEDRITNTHSNVFHFFLHNGAYPYAVTHEAIWYDYTCLNRKHNARTI